MNFSMKIMKTAVFLLNLVFLLPSSSWAQAYAEVPKCEKIRLADLIMQTGDFSPSYQCVVSPVLSRASQPDPKWIASLADPKIREFPFKSVVNLRSESDSEIESVVENGMIAKHIPVKDMQAPTISQVIDFLRFAKDPAHQPVLVHCLAGQGRTGTFVATYRLAIQRWSLDAVIKEAVSFNVNEIQLNFIRQFNQQLNQGQLHL